MFWGNCHLKEGKLAYISGQLCGDQNGKCWLVSHILYASHESGANQCQSYTMLWRACSQIVNLFTCPKVLPWKSIHLHATMNGPQLVCVLQSCYSEKCVFFAVMKTTCTCKVHSLWKTLYNFKNVYLPRLRSTMKQGRTGYNTKAFIAFNVKWYIHFNNLNASSKIEKSLNVPGGHLAIEKSLLNVFWYKILHFNLHRERVYYIQTRVQEWKRLQPLPCAFIPSANNAYRPLPSLQGN